jgi:endonuclease YncB( thermonuclease family)
MLFPKYKYTIRIGVWTLTQWFKFILVLLLVVGVATYVSRSGSGDETADSGAGREIVISTGDGRAFLAEVVDVTDGDTLEVAGPNGRQQVRLNGIDCPEISQSFGHTAKLLTSDMALHRQLTVRVNGRDNYGRTVADLVFPDGRVLNQELVKAGLAWWYRKYSGDSQLATLENEARTTRLGLWSDSEPIAPWEFRNRSPK